MSTRSEIRERWRSILEQQRASGLSITAFCRRRGVLQSGFFKWRHKLSDQLTFAEVKLRPMLPAGNESAVHRGEIELRMPGRRSIVVRPGFDRQTLMEILEVVDVGSAEMARREADR